MPDTLRRRAVLLAGASLLAVYAGTRSQARSITGGVPWMPGPGDAPTSEGTLKFFTSDEAAFIDAAVARLIPADDLGPGAKEAGVTVFLDRQLAGPYGHAETWYMSGPWHDGTKSQGYQSRLNPAALYRTAIKWIDDHCRQKFGGKTFSTLSPDQQDSVLRTAPTDARPTTAAMPAYGWKLSDAEVAAVLTYAGNSWGNATPEITAADVKTVRERLQAEHDH